MSMADFPRVGVLALQGAFEEHCDMLRRVKVDPVEVRLPEDLEVWHLDCTRACAGIEYLDSVCVVVRA